MYDMIITDADECYERTDECQQECINTNGSYSCACRTGYRLTSDGYNCTGKQSAKPLISNAMMH